MAKNENPNKLTVVSNFNDKHSKKNTLIEKGSILEVHSDIATMELVKDGNKKYKISEKRAEELKKTKFVK